MAWLIFAGLTAAALIGAAAVYLIPDVSAMIEAARSTAIESSEQVTIE